MFSMFEVKTKIIFLVVLHYKQYFITCVTVPPQAPTAPDTLKVMLRHYHINIDNEDNTVQNEDKVSICIYVISFITL